MRKSKRPAHADSLHFSWNMDIGADGEDADPMNPFARALTRLLTDGQPLQKLALCFLNLPNSDGDPAALRWLGVFVYSSANRLIFFPGYASVPGGLIGFRGQSMMFNASQPTDHISLEGDRNSWHATTPHSRNHYGGPRPLDIGGGRILWYGMSFPNRDVMREAKKVTKIVADVPASDARRRTDVFKAARESSTFPLVSLNSEQEYDPVPGFYHLSVIVGPAGFELYRGTEHGFPRGSPFLLDPLPDHIQVPIASYMLDMPPHCGLQITLMRLPGRISSSIALTSPGGEQTAG
jgi:hypothetical protein